MTNLAIKDDVIELANTKRLTRKSVTIAVGHTSRDGNQVRMGKVIVFEQAKATKATPIFNYTKKRQREIEKVILKRHGAKLPETDDAEIYIEAVAYSLHAKLAKGECTHYLKNEVHNWCVKHADLASDNLIADICQKVMGCRGDLNQADIGKLLNLKWQERCDFGIRTIDAADYTKAEQKELAKERKRKLDRDRQARKRRAQGCVSRAEYEAKSVSHGKPWEAEGISRRTWYYRQSKAKKENCTSSSRIYNIDIVSDLPVQSDKSVPDYQLHSDGNLGQDVYSLSPFQSQASYPQLKSKDIGQYVSAGEATDPQQIDNPIISSQLCPGTGERLVLA